MISVAPIPATVVGPAAVGHGRTIIHKVKSVFAPIRKPAVGPEDNYGGSQQQKRKKTANDKRYNHFSVHEVSSGMARRAVSRPKEAAI